MYVVSVVGFDKEEAEALSRGFSPCHTLSDHPDKYGEIRDRNVDPDERNMSEKGLEAFLAFHDLGHMKFSLPHLRNGLEVLDALEQHMVERTMSEPEEFWGRTDEAVDANGGSPITGDPDKLGALMREVSRKHIENIENARKVLSDAVEVLGEVDEYFNDDPEDEESF